MIHSSGYLVMDKYTYPKRRQTDFAYQPGRIVRSQNRIAGRLRREDGEELLRTGRLDADTFFKTKAVPDLDGYTGFYLSGVGVEDRGQDAVCSVTFFDADAAESFQTVCPLQTLTKKPAFHLLPLTFAPAYLLVEVSGGTVEDLILGGCHVLNPLGIWGGQSYFYRAEGCTLSDAGTAIRLQLAGDGMLETPEFPDSSATAYNMLMPRRNTVYAVLDNQSDASAVTLAYTTYDHPEYSADATLTVPLEEGKHAYYFNLSATPLCHGRMRSFRLLFTGTGRVDVCSYSFEEEKAIETLGGRILSCHATEQTVTVRGTLNSETATAFTGGKIRIYAVTMADDRDVPTGNVLVGECDVSERFCIDDIPNSDGVISRLPYQFLAFAEKGDAWQKIDERFLIENYADFCPNPYAFRTPGYDVNVLNCGAKGDGFTDDTDAIQQAIDLAAKMGGGRVTVPGDDSLYGRRYIITNLLMRSLVELHIERGAVLWQSQNPYHYCYEVTYGHDGVIPGVNWTHCMHVCNLPMIQLHHLHKVKVTGFGVLRSMDTGSEEGVAMPGYSTGCPDRIHQITLGIYSVADLELSDFSIVRANNYHFSYYCTSRVYIANLKMYEVKCVSGDGPGCQSSHDVCITRCLFQSNDDGVNFTSSYHDPRGIVWWTSRPGEDNRIHRFLITNNYLNSGGGKAIAFITWGTSDPNQERTQISDIEAYGNYLIAVNPVGAWPDNPYNGKVPFDNSETDDYSPVTRVRILKNRYEGNCTVGPIHATDMITDCGIHSASDFRNGDFSLGGFANWNVVRNSHPGSARTVILADKRKGLLDECGEGKVSAVQGLCLEAGEHTFVAEVSCGDTGAVMFALRTDNGAVLAEKQIPAQWLTEASLDFSLREDTDVYLGFRTAGINDGFVMFDHCHVVSHIDREAAEQRKRQAFLTRTEETFCLSPETGVIVENGKLYLTLDGSKGEAMLRTAQPFRNLHFSCSVRVDAIDPACEQYGLGFLFGADAENGCAYLLRMYMEERELRLLRISNGTSECIWKRTNFFFTSLDFHHFDLTVRGTSFVLRVDSALCGQVTLASPCHGDAAVFVRGLRTSLTGLCAESI